MRKLHYLLLCSIAIVISLACNDSEPEPDPDPSSIELSAADFNFSDWGIARVENLDPSDLGSPNPTHVNYAVYIVTTGLTEVQYGEKTFFELDQSITSDEVTAVIFNLYAPITTPEGSAEQNLLGGQSERVFNLADFSTAVPDANEYFFVEASLVKQSFVEFEDNRNFQFREGTITLSGTAPNFTVRFDASMNDTSKNIEATFDGSVTGTFRIVENN